MSWFPAKDLVGRIIAGQNGRRECLLSGGDQTTLDRCRARCLCAAIASALMSANVYAHASEAAGSFLRYAKCRIGPQPAVCEVPLRDSSGCDCSLLIYARVITGLQRKRASQRGP